MSKTTMFPVALDLGAANTGVFALSYLAGASVDSADLQKLAFTAKVPTIKGGGYSLLQTGRTQKRHIRRCQTRNRQAKRLFALILERVFGFDASAHEEAIAELMNRRGYSFVEKADVDFGTPDALDFTEWLTAIESEAVIESLQELDLKQLNQSIDALFEDEPSVIFELEELITEHGWTGGRKKSPEEQFAKNILDFAKDQTKGAKHRRKYFEDLDNDLKHYTEHPSKTVRRLGHELHQHKQPAQSNARFMKVFHRLLCHVSNLELKTLNAMLPKGVEQQSAEIFERNLAEQFGRWILRHWQLGSTNQASRIDEILVLRTQWKTFAEKAPGKLFDFWLQLDPTQTIPPYQNHTNRRPPSCQTLILNPQLLDQQYKGWHQWLEQLDAQAPGVLDDYQASLLTAVSKKDAALANDDEAAARSLQFLLDANQKIDSFRLNAIWSKLKKAHENQRAGKSAEKQQAEIAELLAASALPESLKHPELGEDQPQGSFWHLVNRYFQTRRRTRDGRYFLHYDNSLSSKLNRWQRDGNLLVMCTHRPRQLRHQALQDVMALWGLAESQLKLAVAPEALTLDALAMQLSGIKGLKTHSKDAQAAQKKHGVYLGALLQTDKDLLALQSKLNGHAEKIAALLFTEIEQQQRFVERNSSLYQFAQLYALVWGERSGFGKTCPLCSVDNAQRMQPQAGSISARSSRLNTLSMRLIDGGLKRLLNHQAHHIANRLWPNIEVGLADGGKVSVPLVLEQNRFDFTENLPALKDQPKSKDKASSAPDLYEAKKERIVTQGQGLCPYASGQRTSLDDHELDHIIPRTGPWGVLNDEANLICASRDGNRSKGSRQFSLSDLSPAYLQAQFGSSDVSQIAERIERTLLKPGSEQFVFGQYRQFLALSAEQQTAFRHALFLPDGNAVRTLVIDAIQHRQKARVNGTQRYMAQLLADILWQKARKIGADKRIEFDYFEISSNPSDENSTVALRRILEQLDPATGVDLSPYKKKNGVSQKDYSHVIDAICAMTLAVDAHQGEGALQLNLPDKCSPWGVDETTGEIMPGLFGVLNLPESQLSPAVQVKPQSQFQKAKRMADGETPGQVLSRNVHTEAAVGLRYFDLALVNGELWKGWYYEQGDTSEFITHSLAKRKPAALEPLTKSGFYRQITRKGTSFWKASTTVITAELFALLSERKNGSIQDKKHYELGEFILGKKPNMHYYSTKKPLHDANNILKKGPKDMPDSPSRRQWERFLDGWKKVSGEVTLDKNGVITTAGKLSQQWNDYCSSFLKVEKANKQHAKNHIYSMNVWQGMNGAVTLVKRNDKAGESVFQIMPLHTRFGIENLSVLAMQSPNMVWFDQDVLKKGYVVDLQERADISGQRLDIERLINSLVAEELELPVPNIMAVAKTPAKLTLSGVPLTWFEAHLLETRESEGPEWKKRKSLDYSHKDEERDAINQSTLKRLLSIAPRTDKTVGIAIEGEQITLTLEYKKGALDRFLPDNTNT